MFGLGDKFTNHSLDDTNVAVEQATHEASGEGDPDIGRKSDYEQAEKRADASQEQHWLAAHTVREPSPEHARQRLGKREGAHQQARVQRRILLGADVEPLHERPRIGEDGRERYWLRKADDGWVRVRISRCGCVKGEWQEVKPPDSPSRKSWTVGKSSGL